jgi:hypothetical protein
MPQRMRRNENAQETRSSCQKQVFVSTTGSRVSNRFSCQQQVLVSATGSRVSNKQGDEILS